MRWYLGQVPDLHCHLLYAVIYRLRTSWYGSSGAWVGSSILNMRTTYGSIKTGGSKWKCGRGESARGGGTWVECHVHAGVYLYISHDTPLQY